MQSQEQNVTSELYNSETEVTPTSMGWYIGVTLDFFCNQLTWTFLQEL